MKKVALIPAMLGSKRIPDKNLVLVDGAPMMFRIVEACKKSNAFDEIYINSEHDIFESWARKFDVKFHRRPKGCGGTQCIMKNKSSQCENVRCQTHDHFLYEFMSSLKEPVWLAMVHTTSPLLGPESIKRFMDEFEKENYDCFFSVEEIYTETLFKGNPVNFQRNIKVPTQSLPPLMPISSAINGWKTKAFMEAYDRDDLNEMGPTYMANLGTFPLGRIEATDVDRWEDLEVAEACLQYKRHGMKPGEFKASEDWDHVENSLEVSLKKDGITNVIIDQANKSTININSIVEKMGQPSWAYSLINSSSMQSTLICQKPGEICRKHFHATSNQWCQIIEGEFDFILDGQAPIHAVKGDVVFIPKGVPHQIKCVGSARGIRLSNGGKDMEYVFLKSFVSGEGSN